MWPREGCSNSTSKLQQPQLSRTPHLRNFMSKKLCLSKRNKLRGRVEKYAAYHFSLLSTGILILIPVHSTSILIFFSFWRNQNSFAIFHHPNVCITTCTFSENCPSAEYFASISCNLNKYAYCLMSFEHLWPSLRFALAASLSDGIDAVKIWFVWNKDARAHEVCLFFQQRRILNKVLEYTDFC